MAQPPAIVAPDPCRCRPDCPLAPPDWRWHRAGLLLEGRVRRRRRIDDAAVRRALAFRRRSAPGPPRRPAADPALAAAAGLRAGDGRRRALLEAWLLSGLDDAGIAARGGIEPAAVAAYAATFFDVRGGLGDPAWVRFTALGVDPLGVVGDRDTFLKDVAYQFGPLGLEAALDAGGAARGGSTAAAFRLLERVLATPVDAEGPARWLVALGGATAARRARAEAAAGPVVAPLAMAAGAVVRILMGAPRDGAVDAVVTPAATGATSSGWPGPGANEAGQEGGDRHASAA
jgi:hypothetical protein